jgi:hypothetical protein
MNKYFREIPTPLPKTAAVEALHMQRVAMVFATGETRAVELEVCPIPDTANVAVSMRLDRLGDNPRDGLLQYLTQEGIDRIQPNPQALALGAHWSMDLTT